MQKLLIFFLLILLQLSADPKDPYTLAVTEGEPSSLVEGIVSAITGDLYLAEEDVVVQGHVPLRLPRRYISGNGHGKYAGWTFFNHLKATLTTAKEKAPILTITEPNSSSFTFQGNAQEIYKKYEDKVCAKKSRVHPSKFYPPPPSAGMTNTSHGNISAQTNFKNAYIELEADGRTFTLYCADGTARHYKGHRKQDNFKEVFLEETFDSLEYILQWEKHPAGHRVVYTYDEHDRLSLIRTTNDSGTKTFAHASFHYCEHPSKHANYDVHLSDGRVLKYRYQRDKGKHHVNYYLKEIISPNAPSETINYHEERHYCGPLVGQRTIPGSRYMNIGYYLKEKNYVNNLKIHIKDKHDPRCLRVKALYAPVGSDSKDYATHQFLYDTSQGVTEVLEIDNTYTRYKYSPDTLRLEGIYRHDSKQTLSHYEKFIWNDAGELLSRTFYDASNTPYFTRSFEYDAFGNVLLDKISGNLTGKSPSETAITRRQYSTDGKNLLLRQEEPSGQVTLYTYHPHANLVTSKLVCDGAQIKTRQFYTYNADLVLIQEILDDGTSADSHNLTGVKTRHIKRITPMPSGPFIDMPYVLEDLYWNGSTEVLLKKTLLSYTKGGLPDKKEIYDGEGHLRYTLITHYDDFGRPIEETNALGQTAYYSYDVSGNLTYRIDFNGKKTLLTYDHSNRLTSTQETCTTGEVKTTHHAYDKKHRRTATTDTFGNTTHFTYDNFGNLLQTRLPPTLNEKGEKIEPILSSTYDSAGREITQTTARGFVTRTHYNARNQKTKVEHPDGSFETFIYTLSGQLQSHTNQEGDTTTYTYDIFGRKTSEKDPAGHKTLYTYDSFNLIASTDPLGNTTTYAYDGAGCKITESNDQETLTYTYDSLGRVSHVQNEDLITSYEYDLLNRKIEERKEDLQGNLLFQKNYTYDASGNITTITRPILDQQEEEHFTYDSFGRLTAYTNPLGYITLTTYNEKHINSLNQRVLQKTTIDPLGLQRIETYNSHGLVVRIEMKDSTGTTQSLEEKYYDSEHNLCRQLSTLFPQEHTVTTTWEYTPLNQLKQLTEASGTINAKHTSYTYTKKGLPYQTVKSDGTVLTHHYDRCGNLISLQSSDQTISYVYTYDPLHRLTQSNDTLTNTKTLRHLDHQGRVLRETLANGLTLSRTYDNRGRRKELTLPDFSTITYTYDPLNLKEVSRQNPSQQTLYTHSFTHYDLSRNLLSANLSGDLGTLHYTIDPLGKRKAIYTPYFSQEILEKDPLGHILALKTEEEHSTFSYDPLYQLVEERGKFHHTYQFDSHHNRLQKDEKTTTYNALHQPTDQPHNPCGNPTHHQGATLSYDALDRLLSIESSTHRISFSYDSFHRRLSKTVFTLQEGEWKQTHHELFVYDGLHEIGAATSRHTLTQLRILGETPTAETGSTLAIELNGKPYAAISDLLGNIAALVSLEDQSCYLYFYGAFGDIQPSDPTFPNPWQYASKRLDQETGLIFYGRRYYDPELGRWKTPDPLGFQDSMNLYVFALNSPLHYVDPYGLSVLPAMILPPPVHPDPVAPKPIITPYIPGPLDILKSRTEIKQLYDKSGVPLKEHSKMRFEFGNGIRYRSHEIEKGARYVSQLLGNYNVHFVENVTEGLYKDIERFYQTRQGERMPGTVPSIISGWYDYFQNSPADSIIVRTCHSEGVEQTRLGLSMLPPSMSSRIHVLAVAPAAFIPEETCGSVTHLCSKNDLIAQIFSIREARKAGEMHNFRVLDSGWEIHQSGTEHNFNNNVYKEPLEGALKHLIRTHGD